MEKIEIHCPPEQVSAIVSLLMDQFAVSQIAGDDKITRVTIK